MWTLILLICSISVVSPASSNLWTNEKVTGTVGRSVTINCRYDTWFKSNMKYWCLGQSAHCSYLVRTTDPGGQRGRMSIKDNTAQGVFVVTMEDLRIKDAGWYSCGIDRQVIDELRAVHIEVSDEPVSVPVIRFLTPNIWCFENLVSVSCESVQGSFPIRYTWYERTRSVGSKISESNTLDLHCQLIKQQYHQYYCIASNTQGEKYSEMVKVAIVHRSERNCSFMAQIGSQGSGVVPAKNKITGVLGRAITIDCHYDQWSRWSVKLWMRQCSVLVKSSEHHGQRGRMSITDNTTQNKFSVTMEDLRSEDAGWYNCGIDQSGRISASAVELQISDEPVSVPELRFLSSPPNASCFGSSVSISCESVQGSLPIHYTWRERTPSEASKISNTSKLDLHCQFFKQQRHQYYCTASNTQGEKSSEMVNVSVTHRPGENCSYLAQISTSVSDALWAEEHITGILGRAVTISCHYEAQQYQSHVKYWCQGWSRMCSVRANTNWPNGRISITDNKTQGIFLVTITNLQWEDAGWYNCGIKTFTFDPMFNVKLHISDEAVSGPVLQFLSQPNVSCSGGSVTVSCESAQGSLPIHYTWSEKTPSQDSMISDTNKLDLRCQSFTQKHHRYYCTASNTQGTKPSEMVHVSVNNVREKNCSYRIQTNSIGREYTCDNSSTISPTTSPTATRTSSGPKSVSQSYVVWDVIRWVLFTLLVICSVSVTMFTRKH
ncbi:polymeric immunoglobulin receptor-like [Chiloscyllium punctatum]|uniref:polymeric immunoglobulin receptor-like n=1 Tax=Chiloscyllium punctatum TaxID=137246 RepID=UPI003B634D9A